MSSKVVCTWVSLAIIATLFVGIAVQQGWFSRQGQGVPSVEGETAKSDPAAPESTPPGYQWVGGVLRADADVQVLEPLDLPRIGENSLGRRMGRSPEIATDTNEESRSVAEALADPVRFPERLGPAFPAPDFDVDSFNADPQKYLTTIEPGRIWQSLPKRDGVAQISRESPLYQTLIQGESVTLRVKVVPGAPVTFHSFDLGQFDNQLTTTSVQAGDDGVASVNFTASGGTFGELNILAASPLTSGQVNFVVKVGLPAVAASRF